MKRLRLPRLFDQATAGDTGASAGGAATTDATAAATTEQQTQGEQGTAAENLLNGADAGASQAQADQNYIPEKFHVKKDDGSLDIEASARKLSESYTNLERQRGNIEPPPAAATDYTLTPPDAFKEVFKADDPVLTKMFAKAHAMGMSQKQVDGMMSEFFEFIPGLQQGNAELDSQAASTSLREVWKDEGEYSTNLNSAKRAVMEYAPQGQAEALVNKYGNDPAFIQLMASVGKEMREDRPANTGSQTTPTEDQAVQDLMNSEAYKNPSHADHAKVSQQIKAYFEKKHGTAPAI